MIRRRSLSPEVTRLALHLQSHPNCCMKRCIYITCTCTFVVYMYAKKFHVQIYMYMYMYACNMCTSVHVHHTFILDEGHNRLAVNVN